MWFNGFWKPEASWIDRGGRLLGIAWMFLALFLYLSLAL